MSDTPMTESVDVADTGLFHAAGASAAAAPVDSAMSLLGSLLSLPPRAQKRRRGSRFKVDETPAAEGESKEAASAATTSAAAAAASSSGESAPLPQRPWRERKFEYLDHTADIQLHSWGDTLEEALEQVVLAMFSYVTDLSRVEVDPSQTDTFVVQGHDMDSLLFNLLDEFLYRFATNEWIVRDVVVESLQQRGDRDFSCRVSGYGEHFTLDKHTQGTEIKAITYSNMQIFVAGKRLTSDNDEIKHKQQRTEATAAAQGDNAAAAAAATSATAATAASPAASAPVSGEEVAPPAESAGSVELIQGSETAEQIAKRGQHGAEIYVIVDI